MKKTCFLLAFSIVFSTFIFGQGVAINNTGASADGSAMLDVNSIEGGVLIPRVTLSQRTAIGSPAEGLLVYQTDNTPGFYYYNGASWELVGSGAFSINDLADGRVAGNSIFLGPSTGTLDDGTTNYNVAFGNGALNQNVTGGYNVAVGYNALNASTSSRHTAVGFQALLSNTSGESNTAFGFNAGKFNTSGANNTLIGQNTNLFNQTGSNNTIIGHSAGTGSSGASKSGNILIGYQAGYSESGSNKLYIENSSSSTPLIYGEFDNNILRVNGTFHIGTAYHFPLSDGTSGQVLATDGSGTIGWTTVTTGGGPTALNDLTDAKTGGNNVYIGADAGAADDLNDNRNSALGIAALNALNTGSYNSAFGYRAAYGNASGSWNVAIGPFADRNNQGGSQNIIIGYLAGGTTALHSKSGNIRIGYQAGYSDTTDNKLYIENSSSNTPLIWGDFENDSLRINGTLDINDAYVFPTTDGSSDQILKTNGNGVLSWGNDHAGAGGIDGLFDGIADHNWGILGLGSTFPSYFSGAGNVAVGMNVMDSTVNGSYNTAIGDHANGYNEDGTSNTIIGCRAGRGSAKHTKHSCIMIGTDAGRDDHNSSRLYIEPSSSSTPLIYGEFDNDLIRINGDLEVINSLIADVGIDWLNDARTYSTSLFMGTASGTNAYALYNVGVGDSALAVTTSGNGNTAIGWRSMISNTSGAKNTAIGRETLTDNVYGHGNTAIGFNSGVTGLAINYSTALGYEAVATGDYRVHIGSTSVNWIGGQVTWSTYSDERIKRNIQEDVKGLDFIMKLRPVTFNVDKDNLDAIIGVKSKNDDPGRYNIEKIKQSGFLAQEVEQAAIGSGYDFSGIHAPANENTPYSISYAEFVVPLVKGMQEQQELIEELRQEIEELKDLISQ
jgi:hypothetical protein